MGKARERVEAEAARCACGRCYSCDEWPSLEGGGTFEIEETVLEMRRCTCGSTISRVSHDGSGVFAAALYAR